VRSGAIAAAEKEIDLHGHAGFTVERVAKRLGVSAAALYRHFDNREALLKAFVWEVFLEFARRCDAEVIAAKQPADKLRALGRTYLQFAREHPGWFRLQFSREGAALGLDHESVGLKYPGELSAAITALLKVRSEKKVQAWYLMNWALVHGLAGLTVVERVLGPDQSEDELAAIAEGVLDTFIDGLRPEK
jgi:AcrR family transcriptional regulator